MMDKNMKERRKKKRRCPALGVGPRSGWLMA
jgi:hypothetical protein